MKLINNTIKITCSTKDYLNINELREFQGDLKKRDDENIRKIISSIMTHGFSVPFFVWVNDNNNYVLDGHGRLSALKTLDERGFFIPPLPVVYVDCKNEKQARDLLLRINSQYGKMTKESVLNFIGDFEIETSNFELPCGTISFEDAPDIDFGDSDNQYDDKQEKYGVIVNCNTKEEQKIIFSKLSKEGLNCKVLSK